MKSSQKKRINSRDIASMNIYILQYAYFPNDPWDRKAGHRTYQEGLFCGYNLPQTKKAGCPHGGSVQFLHEMKQEAKHIR